MGVAITGRLLPSRQAVVAFSVSVLMLAIGADATTSLSTCFGRTPTRVGTAGADTLNGTAQTDVIVGLTGPRL